MSFTIFTTLITCWALHEFLERKLGMEPRITTSIDLQKGAAATDNPLKTYEINNRLTKSLNVSGGYRIQTRGSIYFVKSIYAMVLFWTCITIIIASPQWFYDHFIALKADSVHYAPYQHISASLVGFYSWEVIANRYGKLSWSVLVHHWLTAAIALSILLGRYTPFATWYGFVIVSMQSPMLCMLGFRCQYSFKYPEFTRKGFSYSYWWYTCCIVLNFSGQIFLILNVLLYHYNESIHISLICIMGFCMCCWFYDDRKLLQSLKAMSKQKYEKGDILDTANARIAPRALGGVLYNI